MRAGYRPMTRQQRRRQQLVENTVVLLMTIGSLLAIAWCGR